MSMTLFLYELTHILLIPYWAVCAALGVMPLIFLRRAMANRRRRARGACCHCGYDLRATPDRCPECGAVSAREV